ncbi:uncharacterized protein LOC131437285 isoform X2 [Malaya genurostris]|nr:uncharacterized protein LOC131437285 isoform X2 [Malaya genurostris]
MLVICCVPQFLCLEQSETSTQAAVRTGATLFQEHVNEELRDKRRLKKRLLLDRTDIDFENYHGVVGRPGTDYPILMGMPITNFDCRQYGNGYFADLDTKCQVFHICDEGKKISFLCPNGTIFRQLDLICDWWFKVDCAAAPNYYAESSEMLTQAQRARTQSKHPIQQPITSPDQLSLNVQRKHAFLNNQLLSNLNELAFNRRMDAVVDQSDENIDFEDILLKRNHAQHENSKHVIEHSQKSKPSNKTVPFVHTEKKINGYYYYPSTEQKIVSLNHKSDTYVSNRSSKFINENERESSRNSKIIDNNESKQNAPPNSFAFESKPFITRLTEMPLTTTTTRLQTIKSTTSSSTSRGSTTYKTSTLNQKSEYKPEINNEFRNIKLTRHFPPEWSNFSAYSTARKPSTNAKSKPFYTPTIPTVTSKVITENVTPGVQTSPSISQAVKHAMKMMNTLHELKISEVVLENRPGIEVPPSSGPNALHSLALYFANDSERNTSTKNFLSEKLGADDYFHSNSPTLLSKKTIDKYQQLFDAKNPNPITESTKFATCNEQQSGNDLEGQFSRHPIFSSTGSPQIRELAQVFTHALSAYLQDPESFRHILTEIRPKEPTYFKLSSQRDYEIHKNKDISTNETPYISSRQQITLAPQDIITENSEALDFSDITSPSTVKRETTNSNFEVTTEMLSSTTHIQPTDLYNEIKSFRKAQDSNLILDVSFAQKERRSKQLKLANPKTRNELADEVNEEFGTLKPPAFKVVESVEDLDGRHKNISYFSTNGRLQSNRTHSFHELNVKSANSTQTMDTYQKTLSNNQPIAIRWGGKLSASTNPMNSTPTVYLELHTPHKKKLNYQSSIAFLPPVQEDRLEDDKQLQESQSRSSVINRHNVELGKRVKTIYSFLSLDDSLLQNPRDPSKSHEIRTTTPGSDITKVHYITELSTHGKDSAVTTIIPDIMRVSIPDTGKIAPDSKTTLSYTVFLDPLTINDGLMDAEEEAKTTTLNAHTYLPRNDKKTTSTLMVSTIPTNIDLHFSTIPILSKKKHRIIEEESNENELMETMKRKANRMFGDLTDFEAIHLMNVMKTADTNKTVRRLILLLIQTCDDDYNKTVEESRKSLLNELIKMDSQEIDSSEDQIFPTSKKGRNVNESTSTAATPITPVQDMQLEKLSLYFKDKENLEASTIDDAKSTALDGFYDVSTRITNLNYTSDNSDSSTPITNFNTEQYTTTSLPTTITNEDNTTTEPSTTIASLTTDTVFTTIRHAQPARENVNISNRVQKSLGTSVDYVLESNKYTTHHSDTRALELLRSLYSLASRWG